MLGGGDQSRIIESLLSQLEGASDADVGVVFRILFKRGRNGNSSDPN